MTLQDYIKLAESATDGPWMLGGKEGDGDGAQGYVYCDNGLGSAIAICFGKELPYPSITRKEEISNANFIAASRTLGPAMAKALIEAEEVIAGLSANVQVLSNVIKDPNAGTDFQKRFVLEVAKDTVEGANKFVAQIQSLQENKNEQR